MPTRFSTGMDFSVGSGREADESERPALEQLVAMGYEYQTQAEINRSRKKYSDVLLYDRLEAAIARLNPCIDTVQVQDAVCQLAEDRLPHNLPVVDTNEKIRAKLIGLSQTGGLEPVVVTQNAIKKAVHIIDFQNIENNDFLVTNQFKIQGFKNLILLDLAIFVNGIPLVIAECKDPAAWRPIEQAYEKNISRYQCQGLGFERLFFYNHAIIATCGTVARVGTVEANINHYAKWSSAYPYSMNDIKKMCGGRVREQEIAISGLLSRQNILDHLKSFVIYEIANGHKIKKIAMHQQFRAVRKSITRLKEESAVEDKGGVIWHTQGSGKSLSMLWLATKLMYELENPAIIIITDRAQLDKQIHDTFKNNGFPTPVRATNGKHLAELLTNPRGTAVMTTIDKFSTDSGAYTNENVVCMVDEAHRSQFTIKAAQMRAAMPNAVFFGFSGTPIDKYNKNTYRVFGPMLDKYGFRESQLDGATLPIHYEGRLPMLAVDGDDTVDQLYDKVVGRDPALTTEQKERLKKQYITKEKIAEAPSRIHQIALDIVDHYNVHIAPNGYKAMIVAGTREAAVTYKKELDTLHAPASKIIMTSVPGEAGKDGQSWDEFYLSPVERSRQAEKFKTVANPTKILIVVDMLLVGYDVPICQVMYLDKGLKEHNLLQAIARVNRIYDEAKTYGLIVDYFGVTKELRKSIQTFDMDDVNGALDPLYSVMDILREKHLNIMKHFAGIPRNNYDKIIEKFEPANLREKFEHDFKMFSRSLDMVLPSSDAKPYLDDFKFVSIVRGLIRTLYGNGETGLAPLPGKIQQLINDSILSVGVAPLIRRTDITHENFIEIMRKNINSDRAKAALIKARAIMVIGELSQYNPDFYESLRERLQKLIDDEEEKRKMSAGHFISSKQYEEIYKLALSEEKERKIVFKDYVASQFEFAVYAKLCKKRSKAVAIDLAKMIYKRIIPETEIVEWRIKIGVEKRILAILYDVLDEADFDDPDIDRISNEILILARNDL